MTANHHTDISAGASATAATVNSPLGQLDAKINPSAGVYSNLAGDTSTTVTTAWTEYVVSAVEVSVTPAYTGQVFTVLYSGYTYCNGSGSVRTRVYVANGSGTALVDLAYARGYTGAANQEHNMTVAATWTAAAGDVGATRKFKLSVTHSVNGTVVHTCSPVLSVLYH